MKTHDNPSGQPSPVRPLGRRKVCAKPIGAGEDHVKVFHGGTSHLLCCASCATKFEANPGA